MNGQKGQPVAIAFPTLPAVETRQRLSDLFAMHHRRVLMAAYRISNAGVRVRDLVKVSWDYEVSGNYFDMLGVRPELGQLVRALLTGVDGVGPLLVLRTAAGSAGALTAAVDGAGWTEVIGTVAGDDTVLVVTRGPREREAVAARLRALG